jgi:asparagine N-glycosylation enzyme membrane subunit Stt3
MRSRNRDRARTPYKYSVPAAVLGFIIGGAVGSWLGWDPLFTAVGVLLLALVVVDACWEAR